MNTPAPAPEKCPRGHWIATLLAPKPTVRADAQAPKPAK